MMHVTDEIFVSVIIPVFNAQSTIVACAESLLKQTLQAIEFIFVDDCSTDQTAVMLRMIQAQFPDKVKFIQLDQNLGAGGARNQGILLARGKYLGFVDADDVVSPQMFEKLFVTANYGDYDVVDGGFYFEAQDKSIVYTSDELTGILDDQKRSELIVAGGYLWSKLFRRTFWNSQKLMFREHVILEDSEIITKIFATAKSIGNVKEVLYYYKNVEGSLSKQSDCERYVFYCYDAMQAIWEQVSALHNYEGIKKAVEYEILQMYAYALSAIESGVRNDSMHTPLEWLTKLSDFCKSRIQCGFENPYVQNKMGTDEVNRLMQNDASPSEYLSSIFRGESCDY